MRSFSRHVPRSSSGLKLLFEENLEAIQAMREGLAKSEPSRLEWERLRAALDVVARQRDAAWSGLYWYMDFAAAKAAAARAGRPISNELRNNWILHWDSIRPVPKITIDFGDGRKLETTITGNSLHYLLTSNGDVVDVLPGLWGPREFLEGLRGAREKSTGDFLEGNTARANATAGPRHASSPISFEENPRVSSVLDASSLQLMRVKMRDADASAFARAVRNFEQSLVTDTAVNLSLRRTIHQWLSHPSGPIDLATLTNRIYDELFLTPRTDPWLGLVAADTYSAIEGDPGVRTTAAKSPDALRAGGRALSKMIAERPALTALAPPKR
jgi:hypothetical protein